MLIQEREGAWGRIFLNDPDAKNKLSVSFLNQLAETLDGLAGKGLLWLTIESASESLFAAGADMRELLQLDPQSALEYSRLGQGVMDRIARFPASVVALVSGPCFGGAFDLVLACDAIWATEHSHFCHPGAYLGMMTGFGGTVRLPGKLPSQMARHMLATGYRLPAADAGKMGLVQRCFSSKSKMISEFRLHVTRRDHIKRSH